MSNNFPYAVRLILSHEGGLVDHPKDPGGITNMGITMPALKAYRGRPVTPDDIRRLTKEEASKIYEKDYWDKMHCDEMPAGVDLVVFDQGVNSGNNNAVKLLQRTIGMDPDGVVGPATLKRLHQFEPGSVVKSYSDARLEYYKKLKHWPTFGKGWERRTRETEEAALKMVQTPAKPQSSGFQAFIERLLRMLGARR